MHPRRTMSDRELEVSVSDVQVIGHAQLKEELAVGITLSLGTRLVLMANKTPASLLRCGALPDQKNV